VQQADRPPTKKEVGAGLDQLVQVILSRSRNSGGCCNRTLAEGQGEIGADVVEGRAPPGTGKMTKMELS